ncbi:uncharacterized protein F5Z01DRAFT_672699 [Emericellopsis atlantica]|uniref:Uncharacterized protein n=1 Tax=Emericellopsis atlantica TaxID=2614577 RepID=A0A9P7ZPT1_9HYPO|nr:uncharacterized protein F5Z01DRAFT_672699 [Emericellopsis atlantica]KAG9256058.1 hypothetical protein F5Z01DRAFT_672699 [Emericellopsis atlantica]
MSRVEAPSSHQLKPHASTEEGRAGHVTQSLHMEFDRGLPDRPRSIGPDFSSRPRFNSRLDDDTAASEWETVAGGDEQEDCPPDLDWQLKRKRNFELVSHAQDILHPPLPGSTSITRRYTVLGPPHSALAKLPTGRSRARLPGSASFRSCSSFDTESFQDAATDSRYTSPNVLPLRPLRRFEKPAPSNTDTDACSDLKNSGRISDSIGGNPFEYDAVLYSTFLQPAAEKEVDDDVKVPVNTKPSTPSDPEPQLSRRLSGDIATLIRSTTDHATDGDWQTVTEDCRFGPSTGLNELGIKGTGSSLADLSDGASFQYNHFPNRSTDRIIQHPQPHGANARYHVRTDKHTNRPVLLPDFRNNDVPTLGPVQNSSRKTSHPASRAAAAIRRFSNSLRRELTPEPMSLSPKYIEMDSFGHGHASVESEHEVGRVEENQTPAERFRFRGSQIIESFARDPSTPNFIVFDKACYGTATAGETHACGQSHVLHDEFTAGIPRLPFPLVSLPEAALLQHFRRERGEEDHTENGSSFSAKARSVTLSSVTSSQPLTPQSPFFDYREALKRGSLPFPATTLPPSRLRGTSRWTASTDDGTEMPELSPAHFRTVNTNPAAPHTPCKPWYKSGSSDSWAILGDRLPIFHSRPMAAGDKMVYDHAATDHRPIFHHADAMSTAREHMMLRRRSSTKDQRREEAIFLGVVALTACFPPIGILALNGQFDATISWFTHGELHEFSRAQRRVLQQQLLAVCLIYPTLVISLSVYFAVSK